MALAMALKPDQFSQRAVTGKAAPLISDDRGLLACAGMVGIPILSPEWSQSVDMRYSGD